MGPASINKLSRNMANTLTKERKKAPRMLQEKIPHEPNSATRTTCVKAVRAIDGGNEQHVEKGWKVCVAFGEKMSQNRGDCEEDGPK